MADRRKPETGPILDGPGSVHDKESGSVAMPKPHFDAVIRYIKWCTYDSAKVVRTATYNTLKRLRVKRDPSKAINWQGPANAQGDTGSLVTWLSTVEKKDKKAVKQVIAIDATAVRRTS